MKKMTKKEMFAMVKSVVASADVAEKEAMVEFLDHEVELIEKKAGSKKATKTQKENEGILDVIRETLASCESGVTVSELQAKSEVLGELSNQKVSALVRKLVENGEVEKAIDKKRSVFSLVAEAEEDVEELDIEEDVEEELYLEDVAMEEI